MMRFVSSVTLPTVIHQWCWRVKFFTCFLPSLEGLFFGQVFYMFYTVFRRSLFLDMSSTLLMGSTFELRRLVSTRKWKFLWGWLIHYCRLESQPWRPKKFLDRSNTVVLVEKAEEIDRERETNKQINTQQTNEQINK